MRIYRLLLRKHGNALAKRAVTCLIVRLNKIDESAGRQMSAELAA